MTTPIKLTRLQAVNRMLSALGEAPVNSITSTTDSQTALCLVVLDECLSDVLLEGWAFNSEKDVTYQLDSNSQIALPADVIDLVSKSQDVTIRDGLVYSRTTHTNVFSAPLTLNVLYYQDFDAIPEAARAYVAARAARTVYERLNDQSDKANGLLRTEGAARLRLQQQEADCVEHNILTGNWGTFRTLNRPNPLLNL